MRSASIFGLWASAAETRWSAALAENPKIDAILSGGYIASDIKAFQRAGRKPVPATRQGRRSFVSGMALQNIVILDRSGNVPKSQPYWTTNYVSSAGNIDFTHEQQVEPVKAGQNYFPDQSRR